MSGSLTRAARAGRTDGRAGVGTLSDDPELLERGLAQLAASQDVLAGGILHSFTELDWYTALDPRLRAWIQVLVQNQVRLFCERLGDGEDAVSELGFLSMRPAGGAHISAAQTTELIRRGCAVLADLSESIVDPALGPQIRSRAESFLRDTAFDLAQIYARAAERRGATDARRQEDLIGGLVEGLSPAVLAGRAAGLTMPSGAVRAFGVVPAVDVGTLLADLQWRARREGLPLVAAVHAGRVVGVTGDDLNLLGRLLPPALARVIVVGEPGESVPVLGASMGEVLAGVQVSAAYRGTERIVTAEELVPERALCGDPRAREALTERCVTPLLEAGGDLLETVEALLAADGVLGTVARALPAHVNTVRYRLGRVLGLTGRDPRRLRDALEFQIAIAHYRVSSDLAAQGRTRSG